jgi:hypothetical protein
MIDLAKRVSNLDTGVSALIELVFNEMVNFLARLNYPEIVGHRICSALMQRHVNVVTIEILNNCDQGQ